MSVEIVGGFPGIDVDNRGLFDYFRGQYAEWFPTLSVTTRRLSG